MGGVAIAKVSGNGPFGSVALRVTVTAVSSFVVADTAAAAGFLLTNGVQFDISEVSPPALVAVATSVPSGVRPTGVKVTVCWLADALTAAEPR